MAIKTWIPAIWSKPNAAPPAPVAEIPHRMAVSQAMDKSADRSVPLWRRPIRTGGGLEVAGAAFGAFQDPLYRQHAASEKASAELGQREALSELLANAGDQDALIQGLAPLYPDRAIGLASNRLSAEQAATNQKLRDQRIAKEKEAERLADFKQKVFLEKIKRGKNSKNIVVTTRETADGKEALIVNKATGASGVLRPGQDPSELSHVFGDAQAPSQAASSQSQAPQGAAQGAAQQQGATPDAPHDSGPAPRGTNAAQLGKKRAEKRAVWEAARPEKLQKMMGAYRRLEHDAREMRHAAGQIMERAQSNWATGITGQAMSNFWSTDATTLRNAISRLTSRAALKALQTIRQNSPTGGSLGNVSDRDIQLLKDAAAGISQSDDPKVIVEQTRRFVRQLDEIMGQERAGFQEVSGYLPEKHREMLGFQPLNTQAGQANVSGADRVYVPRSKRGQ